ncbi:hypothetical protein EV696_1364 [Permianibacter aggregans]|uniref:Uncharacterized protein n=1 Tax=Permianibacter aggregans TaxID=1510150 RepID=A0A4R6U6P5_9GAMM|nr:hypothetical protein EV696_1364 [Permianibacter aggregans]
MKFWRSVNGGENYTVTLQGNLVRLTKDSGTPESFGGNDVHISRFLRSNKLQQHIKDVFGEAKFLEIHYAARAKVDENI